MILADAGCDVRLWARESEVADTLNRDHANERYLPGVSLPTSIVATADYREALTGATIVVVAIPSQVARKALQAMADAVEPNAVIVALMKGVELGTLKLMTEVVAESLGVSDDRIAVISGPNLAREIAVRQPSATVVASTSDRTANIVAEACTTAYFRPYTNGDIIGVELCGAVKNVIAVAVGMARGLGYGWNTTATLITRGSAEVMRLGLALGARMETFAGLAGMGDMVATCASPLSRNHTLGFKMGEGMTLDAALAATGGTAEGVKSSESVQSLAEKIGVEMPITNGVVAVLHGRLPIQELGPSLLGRPRKSETE
jgi:glycerol-3-phosphate dehydrogenase (NAD(P)+)